jgi:hypothetical protein
MHIMEPTTVCCVKVKNLRPKYANLKEWMAGPNNIYIGRAGIVFIDGERFPKRDSIWANPFKITGDRDAVIQKYKVYIMAKLELDTKLVTELLALNGKTLGCWCSPEACHGDVFGEIN